MRRTLAILIASTLLMGAPVVPHVAEAATLFERLFPRAAERRKQRSRAQILRQQEALRRKNAAKRYKNLPAIKKIKAPTFKKYTTRTLKTVRLSSLAAAFSAYDQKLLAADAVEQVRQKQSQTNSSIIELENGATLASVDTVKQPTTEAANATPSTVHDATPLNSQPVGSITPVSALPRIRLSAAHHLLGKLKHKARSALSKAVISHYKNNPQFLWLDDEGQQNENARNVLKVLSEADSVGLRAQSYELPRLDLYSLELDNTEVIEAAQFEFALTIAAMNYMADAKHGLVDPNRISGYHDFSKLKLNYKKQLKRLAQAPAPDEMLIAAHPKDKSFGALVQELANLRQAVSGFDSIVIDLDGLLRPGQSSNQLENIVESIRRKANDEMLKKHFDVFAVDHFEGDYNDEVVAMVRDFQKSKRLTPDGIIGKKTIARMVGDDPNVKLRKVELALERLRWHPDKLGNKHVFINQPAYRATYMVNGQPSLSMRTVVGKPSNQTNFFYDEIEYVEFNPYWGIPKSILVNEMLPKLRRNASYFDNIGYELTDIRGKPLYSSQVDWHSVGANFPFNVRQPPGAKNALGELKIMFPNKHSIYMHDTPAKSLFKRTKRAYSHGCVRLAEPRKMAAAVLGTSIGQIDNHIYTGENNRRRLKSKVAVYVAYFTAWPENNGTVKFFGDVYGRDKALAKALAMEIESRNTARDV